VDDNQYYIGVGSENNNTLNQRMIKLNYIVC